MGRGVNFSWAQRVIFSSSQCFTTDETKAVVGLYVIVYMV